MTVLLYNDYPGLEDLQIVNSDGEPVEGADIRVYEKLAYDQQEYDTWVGATTTDINGEWVAPIAVASGGTYVVHVEKPTMYGPATVEVTT